VYDFILAVNTVTAVQCSATVTASEHKHYVIGHVMQDWRDGQFSTIVLRKHYNFPKNKNLYLLTAVHRLIPLL